jgi:hypothetical protein
MRWDSQKIDREKGRSLPGLDVERVRTFDAPEALGINFHEVRAKSALNKVPGDYLPFNWTVNAFRGCAHACVYCFARNTHTYLDLDAGRDFEREIVVKVNVPELLRAELAKPSWKRELVAFGTNTDPYQWAEGKYELMPPMIEALRETETPTSILTKSSLVKRDLDLYLELAEVADVSVNFSVPTLDEKIWRQTEPHAASAQAARGGGRVQRSRDSSGVLVAPLMPGNQRLAGGWSRRSSRSPRRQGRRSSAGIALPAAGGEGGLHVLALRLALTSSRATTILPGPRLRAAGRAKADRPRTHAEPLT